MEYTVNGTCMVSEIFKWIFLGIVHIRVFVEVFDLSANSELQNCKLISKNPSEWIFFWDRSCDNKATFVYFISYSVLYAGGAWFGHGHILRSFNLFWNGNLSLTVACDYTMG